jgi:hypothetical protein
MSSFDQSLKHLLHSRPEDFLRFGMGDPSIEVLEPAEAALPARPAKNRDVDGGYRFRCGAELLIGHVEFDRRHQSKKDLRASERADHLAVLRFVGEKENVALSVLSAYISREELMASTLYREIFKEGKAEGEAKAYADVLVQHLIRRLGALDPALKKRIRKTSDLDTLKVWYNEVVDADKDAARRLADKIRSAPFAEASAQVGGHPQAPAR